MQSVSLSDVFTGLLTVHLIRQFVKKLLSISEYIWLYDGVFFNFPWFCFVPVAIIC